VRADHLTQLGQDPGQGGRQSGGFARAEDDGPAAGVDQQGVVAAGLGVAAFGVPALGDRAGTGVGHEVVVNEVDRVTGRFRREHPGGECALQPKRVAGVGQGRPPGPQARQLRNHREPDRGAGLGAAQVLGPHHRAGAQTRRPGSRCSAPPGRRSGGPRRRSTSRRWLARRPGAGRGTAASPRRNDTGRHPSRSAPNRRTPPCPPPRRLARPLLRIPRRVNEPLYARTFDESTRSLDCTALETDNVAMVCSTRLHSAAYTAS